MPKRVSIVLEIQPNCNWRTRNLNTLQWHSSVITFASPTISLHTRQLTPFVLTTRPAQCEQTILKSGQSISCDVKHMYNAFICSIMDC